MVGHQDEEGEVPGLGCGALRPRGLWELLCGRPCAHLLGAADLSGGLGVHRCGHGGMAPQMRLHEVLSFTEVKLGPRQQGLLSR